MERSMRVLLVQDSTGHSTGYHVISRGLRDAGMETVLGGAQIPRAIARLAVDEAADAIGYRIMDASPAILVERLMEEIERVGLRGIPVVVGGIVPEEDLGRLEALGVAGVFQPGATLDSIATFFRGLAQRPARQA
ncbi:MAG: cobalamin-dependent protein [candidate division NC10 bacterium]